jgi:UDP-glucose 4-epimerase
MHIWVTGSRGQIGTRLCAALDQEGHTLTRFARTASTDDAGHEYTGWDMSTHGIDAGRLQTPDAVVHLAAQTSAYVARQDVQQDLAVNVAGFIRLLDAAREVGNRPHVILLGAATEVGLNTDVVICDEDPDYPLTFYDVGKVAQRMYLQQYHRERWVDGTSIRIPNVYGGMQEGNSDRGFLNRSVRQAILGESLTFYNDGDYVRDYLHVDDVVSAVIAAIDSREAVSGETFLVGTGSGTSIRDMLTEVANQVGKYTGAISPIFEVAPPAELYVLERRNVIVDSSRFTNQTGWTPRVALSQGISGLVAEMNAAAGGNVDHRHTL